jgi:hypothetical protein
VCLQVTSSHRFGSLVQEWRHPLHCAVERDYSSPDQPKTSLCLELFTVNLSNDELDIPENEPAQTINTVKFVAVLTVSSELLAETLLALGLLGGLHDSTRIELVGRYVHLYGLGLFGSGLKTVTDGEKIFPLRVGSRGVNRRNRGTDCFSSVRSADEADNQVAASDVPFERLDEGTRALLKILLHADLVFLRSQIAGDGIATLSEF